MIYFKYNGAIYAYENLSEVPNNVLATSEQIEEKLALELAAKISEEFVTSLKVN